MTTIQRGRSPAPGKPRARRLFIDWARGLAVLCMIEHHSFDAWMPVSFHGSAPDRLFRFLGGNAAPSFLFLAGLAVVLGLEGQLSRGTPRFEAALASARRGGWILLGAYLFRFQEWALAFGGSPPESMLRIDILNCIGIALVLVALCWALAATLPGRALVFALLCSAVFFAAPHVWAAPLSGWPQLLADYVHGTPPRALFPLFPWLGYAFAGALCGLPFAWIRGARDPAGAETRLVFGLGAGSVALWFAVLYLDRLPGTVFAQLNWWKTSPAYALLRCCSVLWILCLCWGVEKAFARFWARLPTGPLAMLGRHSLVVYWVHVEIVYGRWTWPLRGKLSLGQASAFLALLLASQVALAYFVDPVKAAIKRLWGAAGSAPAAAQPLVPE